VFEGAFNLKLLNISPARAGTIYEDICFTPVGLPNAKVPDEIEKFVKQYIDTDEIFESLLLNKLKELYKDLKWEFPPLNANVTKFFSFG